MDTYLFVINSFGAGGAERSLLELLAHIRLGNVKPVVAALRLAAVGFEDEVRRGGYQVELIGGSNPIQQVIRLRRLIKQVRPALVHTSLFDADIVGRLAAIGTGVPVVSSLVNTSYDPIRLEDPGLRPWKLSLTRAIDSWTARHLTLRFHAVSHAVKESAVADLRLPPDRITVVERGRDPAVLGAPSEDRRAEVRRHEGIPAGGFVFITVGRQEYQKGQSHLLRAFQSVAETSPDCLLLVVGREGNATRELNALLEELKLGPSTRLLGHREDVADLLAAADVFVFPSLYEGLGGALIEAMALGLPVIASDIPALREATGGEDGAILVPAGDSAALAKAMIALKDDAGLRRRMSVHNRSAFLTRYQSISANERLFDLLAKAAKPGS